MNNEQILKKRWSYVDKELTKFLRKYKKVTKELNINLQDIFDTLKWNFNDASKPLTKKDKTRLKKMYKEWLALEIMNIAFSKRVQRALITKSSNREMLQLSVEAEYLKRDKELDETTLFKNISEYTYKQGSKEAKAKPKRPKWIISDFLLLLISSVSPITGHVWGSYKNNDVRFNAEQITNQVLINMQQQRSLNVDNAEFKLLIDRQQRRYLNKKKKPTVDKFSGSLDVKVTEIVNGVLAQAYLDSGIKKVRFIAVMDGATTHMCRSLDNQTFWVAKTNKFERYSVNAKGIIEKNIVGLKEGVNLPPINDGFHYCRSTIIPEFDLREEDKND
jgi:hypothetical protein